MKLKVKSASVLKVVRPVTVVLTVCGFREEPQVVEEYKVILQQSGSSNSKLWELHLYTEFGECGSGYTTAEWGKAEIKKVEQRGPATHLPIKDLEVELDPYNLSEDFECEAFTCSSVGGDEYYPCGSVSLNTGLFRKTGRGHNKPVVQVFTGGSNLGKSTIALSTSLKVYETDESETLDSSLVYAQIVVIGNKYSFSTKDIESEFSKQNLDVEIVPVLFGVKQDFEREPKEIKSSYLVKVAIEIPVTLVDDSPGLLYNALQKPLDQLTQEEMQQLYISLEEGVRAEIMEITDEEDEAGLYKDIDIVSVRKIS